MIALLLLGSSTVAVAFLPGYDQIGSASALMLIVFRLGQGLALGGEWDGLASLLALNAPEKRSGWYAMLPQLGAPLGLIVASGLFAFFLSSLPARGLSRMGLAISVLRRLRDQRRRVVRAVAAGRIAGIRQAVRGEGAAAVPRARHAALGGQQHRHRRLRAARELRVVPHRHGVSAVLGAPVHARKRRPASWSSRCWAPWSAWPRSSPRE